MGFANFWLHILHYGLCLAKFALSTSMIPHNKHFTIKINTDRMQLMKMNKKRYKRHKNLKITYIIVTLFTLFFCLLFVPGYTPFESTGENFFHVSVNGVAVGSVADEAEAEKLFTEARKAVASAYGDLVFLEASMEITGEEVLYGTVDSLADVRENMIAVLQDARMETMHRSYTVKVNEYMVNLASAGEVKELLQAAIDKYDTTGNFRVDLVHDTEREISIMTAQVSGEREAESALPMQNYMAAGVELLFEELASAEDEEAELGFEDYTYGLMEMDFSEEVEIVEAYLPENQLTDVETAISQVVMEQETPREYEVVSGDTLSEISIKVNIPMDRIVEMNSELLPTVDAQIHIGDKLTITVPKPGLSVTRTEQNYYEEIYDADVIYIENNDWYTTQTKIHQQPSAGFRKVVAREHYLNDKLVARDIEKEEVIMEAIPKIVERGTRIPPTYIKPISGGRQSSGFGKRSAPKKGASTYHKGIDWAVPTGTAVNASCGGVVAKAGWGSGYGYVVYINHEDGRQTRYGHLSKVLVKAGDSVKQGDRIGLSGNTGVSTGPHLHFEILINGTQVNPLKYLN